MSAAAEKSQRRSFGREVAIRATGGSENVMAYRTGKKNGRESFLQSVFGYERDRKPGSVLDDHLSRPRVTAGLKRLRRTRRAADLPPLHLAPGGVYSGNRLPGFRVSSYLAFPSLPSRGRRFISVALSLESPPPAVSRHPCPAVPGLSSYLSARDRLFTSHPRGMVTF